MTSFESDDGVRFVAWACSRIGNLQWEIEEVYEEIQEIRERLDELEDGNTGVRK